MSNSSHSSDQIDIKNLQEILNRIDTLNATCDSKSSITLATLGIFLVLGLSEPLLGPALIFINSNKNKKYGFLLVILLFFVFISLILLGLSLHARIRNREENGISSIVFFGDIVKFENADEYDKALENGGKSMLKKSLVLDIYRNAEICRRKFRLFNYGLWIAIVSSILLLLFVIVVNFIAY